jgi:hypothetical protein
VDTPDFSRVLAVPGPALITISIGSIFAWSMWNGMLSTRELGVVVSSSGDWGLGSIVPVFSTMAISFGFATFFLGPWADKAGPRMAAACAALCYGGGMGVAALDIASHTLPLAVYTFGMVSLAESVGGWRTFRQ